MTPQQLLDKLEARSAELLSPRAVAAVTEAEEVA